MDARSQEHFKRILKKDLSILTDEDKRYLNARQSYLTEDQKIKYGLVKVVTKAKKVTK